MMSTLDNIYGKFLSLEDNYLSSGLTRKEFVLQLFGGDIEIGATILTDAILKEGVSKAKDIEKFSFLKDIFSFFIKQKNNLDFMSTFNNPLDNNEITNDTDILNKLVITLTQPVHAPIFSQKDLYKENQALHYVVTPDSIKYVSLDDCHAFKIMNENFAILLKTLHNTTSDLSVSTVYIKGERGLRKCKKNELLPYLEAMCGE